MLDLLIYFVFFDVYHSTLLAEPPSLSPAAENAGESEVGFPSRVILQWSPILSVKDYFIVSDFFCAMTAWINSEIHNKEALYFIQERLVSLKELCSHHLCPICFALLFFPVLFLACEQPPRIGRISEPPREYFFLRERQNFKHQSTFSGCHFLLLFFHQAASVSFFQTNSDAS